MSLSHRLVEPFFRAFNYALIPGFIDFIVEPTMMVCSEMLMKMVEPLVCLPSSDSLFPPNNDGRDGSVSANSLSPIPPDL